MGEILNFSKYEKLFEGGENDENLLLISQIMTTFFDIYSSLLPIADGYDKILADLEKLIDGETPTKEDPTGKVKVMEDMIKSVSSSIDDKRYLNVVKLFNSAFENVSKAYIDMLAQYDKGDTDILNKIGNLVSKSAVGFTTSIKSAKKEIKESVSSNSKYDRLFEAVHNKRERKEIKNVLVAKIANLENELNTGSMDKLSGTLQKMIDELNSIDKKISNDDYWKGRKRADRKDELEKMISRINNEIDNEIIQKKNKIIRTSTSNEKASSSLLSAMSDLVKAREELGKVSAKEIHDMEVPKGKDDNTKEEKKREYSNIDPSDIKNSRKDGENRETIKDYQSKINELFKNNKGYKEIATDGLYGEKTKNSIIKIQKVLNKLGAGLNEEGTLTAQTQKSIDGLFKNKETIASILKSDSKNKA